MSHGGFYPLRAIVAALYCACGHHQDTHKPVCQGVGKDSRPCPCTAFRKCSPPKEPT